MTKQARHLFVAANFRKLVCGIVVVGGFALLISQFENKPEPKATNTEENSIEVFFSEETSVSFDENNKLNILYEEKPVTVTNSEKFSPMLLTKSGGNVTLGEDLIGEFIENNIETEIALQNNNLYKELPIVDSENIEKLYEEELPEDVLLSKSKPETNTTQSNITNTLNKEKVYSIAVVIDDMGISAKRTADISSLKAPITSSFLTYANNLDKQIKASINAGHEIMVHVPMEAQTNKDVAPDVLTTKMTVPEIKNNLKKMLAKFKNVKGANNHMGSRLTEDKERMVAIMEVLKENNMFFLDSKTSAKSQAEVAAQNVGIGYDHRHVFIDNNNDKQYILGQLQKAENVAKKHGYAIAIGHPKSQTYEALKEWLPSLREKKIKLKKLSEIISIKK